MLDLVTRFEGTKSAKCINENRWITSATDPHLSHGLGSSSDAPQTRLCLCGLASACAPHADDTHVQFASLTFTHARNQLLAFLNSLLKFRGCRMPVAVSLLSIYHSQFPAPGSPCRKPRSSDLDTSSSMHRSLICGGGYKSQVGDEDLPPLLCGKAF